MTDEQKIRSMTPEEFEKAMQKIHDDAHKYYAKEQTHITMDELMCDLLRSLGYGTGVDIFEAEPKWYS